VPARTTEALSAKAVAKSPDDVAQHSRVHVQRVGIDRRHVTASPQRVQPDDGAADVELGTRPLALAQSLDAADEDVGTQTVDVMAEGGNGAVGGDEQRQDVEAVEAGPRLEPRVRTCCAPHERQRVGAVPGMAVDAGVAVRIERAPQSEEAVLAPRCAHAFGAPHAHDAIAGDAVGSNHRRRERFSGQ
jgi:hypothetical protein